MNKFNTIKMIIILGFMYLISCNSYAGDLNIGYGLNTTHIKYGKFCEDYDFVESNKIITLEYKNDKNVLGITNFTNSFGNNSTAIYIGNIVDKNNKGFYGIYRVGVVKGYNKTDYLPSKSMNNKEYVFDNYLVFYKDYSLLLTYGIGYKINDDISIETNLISNAIITNIKIKL